MGLDWRQMGVGCFRIMWMLMLGSERNGKRVVGPLKKMKVRRVGWKRSKSGEILLLDPRRGGVLARMRIMVAGRGRLVLLPVLFYLIDGSRWFEMLMMLR